MAVLKARYFFLLKLNFAVMIICIEHLHGIHHSYQFEVLEKSKFWRPEDEHRFVTMIQVGEFRMI